MRAVFFLLFLVQYSHQEVCDPDKCELPNCRCFEDPKIPGGLAASETPQIVVVSFENNINSGNVDLYRSLFAEVKNPNGCEGKGSFYIEDDGTDYEIVKDLFDNGHEIGIHSLDGTTPKDNNAWLEMYKNVLSKLSSIGLDSKEIHGTRVPQLSVGSDDQFIGMGDNNILYDTSCVSVQYSSKETFLWPYTLDVMPVPACDIGKAPSKPFPGKWEFMLADLFWEDIPCATPAACLNVTNKKDSFDLFFNSFIQHYEGNKAPFVVIINPVFAKKPEMLEGAIEFLEYVRAAFEDTWVVPAYKALQWIQDPTPSANLTDFQPWKC